MADRKCPKCDCILTPITDKKNKTTYECSNPKCNYSES